MPAMCIKKKKKQSKPLTNISASRKTHFVYWVSVQQWNFVKVTPSSGRFIRVKWAESPESRTSTVTTALNTCSSRDLETIKIIVQIQLMATRANPLHKELSFMNGIAKKHVKFHKGMEFNYLHR